MARVFRLIDDLDGTSEADRTVVFAADGVVYAIDLAEQNIGKLRAALEPYIGGARRVGTIDRGLMRTATVPTPADAVDNNEIRNWAATVGKSCPPRGRVPQQLRDEYNKAHRL